MMNTVAGAMILGICALGLAVSSSRAGADDTKKNPVIVIDTSMGKIKAELWADKAPGTVENFLKYVEKQLRPLAGGKTSAHSRSNRALSKRLVS